VIERYTREAIGSIWTQRRKLESWLEVELAVVEALVAEGVVPENDARACRERASFTVEAVEERERTTNHDVAAFVDVVGESIGEPGRWLHYGLTSSDVLDTALATQLVEAGTIVTTGARDYRDALIERALEHRDTVSVGRTHGVHAEPTSFGLRLAGFAFEADRNTERLRRAFEQSAVGKLSGAVGTYASLPPSVERRVMEELGLNREDASTQIVPRDRHAEVLGAIALAAAGQKGSSAMPHKRNPITTERITGLARVMRGYAQAGLENVALWHERDISHSGAERVILPDATIGLDYMQHLGRRVASEMVVHSERMRENLELTYGAIYSQRALTALLDAGLTRDHAYRIIQANAQRAWDSRTPFRELLAEAIAADAEVPEVDLDAVFDPGAYLRNAGDVFERLEQLAAA
jgi:adenylosuccinate lyase